MKFKLIAFLLKRTALRSWAYAQLGSDLSNIAHYAPSAWENEKTKAKRELYVALGGPDKTLTGWR